MEGGATNENHSRIDNVDHQRRPSWPGLAVEHGPSRSDANSGGTPTPGVLLCDSRAVNRRVGETTLLTRPRRSAEDGVGVPPATFSSESTPEPTASATRFSGGRVRRGYFAVEQFGAELLQTGDGAVQQRPDDRLSG